MTSRARNHQNSRKSDRIKRKAGLGRIKCLEIEATKDKGKQQQRASEKRLRKYQRYRIAGRVETRRLQTSLDMDIEHSIEEGGTERER